jgi:hypothetical protein
MSTVQNAIVFSDLHLGRTNSYLNSRDQHFKKNRAVLVKWLKDLGDQDELILNGDFMELSLCGWDVISRDVVAFWKILLEAGVTFRRIVYIPGNHDHHFWRLSSEQVHIEKQFHQGQNLPSHEEYPHFFVDSIISNKNDNIPCDLFLKNIWTGVSRPELTIKYPHHLVKLQRQDLPELHYLFTHGHFLEDRFKPINRLIEPSHLEELEAFNNIWLEAFDYHLGHAGRLSDRVLTLVENYEEGGSEAKKKVKEILYEIYINLHKNLKLKKWQAWILKQSINYALKKVPLERKSQLLGAPLNQELKENIKKYINTYLLKRYQKDKANDLHLLCDKNIPKPFIFVFAHTHKPFSEPSPENEIELNGLTFPLINTGGWVRKDEFGTYKGENAGMLVLDKLGHRWISMAELLE